MISHHVADKRLPRAGGAVEREHQGPNRGGFLDKARNLLRDNVLGQMLTIDIFIEIPLQVWL